MPRMTRSTRTLPDGYQEYAAFDRKGNPLNRRISYVMHFAAVVFFVPLFAALTAAVRPGRELDPVDLWAARLPGFGFPGTLALLLVVSAAVLYLHPVIHAAVLRLVGHATPVFATSKAVLSVLVPGWYLSKPVMIIVAVAPFFLISIVGTVLLSVVPSAAIAWVYVPLVANAVVTARDVMTLSWVLVTPRKALFTDDGVVLTTYAMARTGPPGARPS